MRRLFLAPFLGLALLAADAAHAQTMREVPQSRAEITQSFAPLVKRSSPAVVNVYAARKEKVSNPLFDDPFFRDLFGGRGGVPQERMERSVGSGVLVDAEGIVVTNHHVIEGMTELKVALADRREFEAVVLLRDPKTDLAILKLKTTEKFPILELGNSDDLQVGDLVLAIGNPFGVGQTVTQGIISALARTNVDDGDYRYFVQTDAAINPGNSGGALIDMQGRLIGINTAIFSKSGGSHGIGFAIPANMVRVVMNSAKAGGKQVKRPWYGARMQAVTAEIAETIGLARPVGALVSSVVPEGPAAVSGLKPGDVIIEVDGLAIDDPEAFGFRYATKPLGGTVAITIMRDKRKLVLPTRLMPAPETRPRDQIKLTGRTQMAGLTVENLSPAVTEELSLSAELEGVVVTDVLADSPAQEFGFQKGDVIVSINGTKVTTTKALDEQLRQRMRAFRLAINRGGQIVTAVMQ